MEVTAPYQSAETAQKQTAAEPRKRWIYLAVKRGFDFFFALAGLIVLAIPMLIITGIIVLDSPGKAIFRQKRIGQNGKVFTIFKFRTMYTYAPSDAATNSIDTSAYITGVGRFLRLYGLDELPQLWNILRGNMSFVGYRPVCLSEQRLNQLRAEYGVLKTKPGITGYAQINGRDNVMVDEKVQLDLYYAEHCSVWLDLRCIFKTVKVVLTKEGAN